MSIKFLLICFCATHNLELTIATKRQIVITCMNKFFEQHAGNDGAVPVLLLTFYWKWWKKLNIIDRQKACSQSTAKCSLRKLHYHRGVSCCMMHANFFVSGKIYESKIYRNIPKIFLSQFHTKITQKSRFMNVFLKHARKNWLFFGTLGKIDTPIILDYTQLGMHWHRAWSLSVRVWSLLQIWYSCLFWA